jgi:prepilin-type processing-associated H-X9-DG protein
MYSQDYDGEMGIEGYDVNDSSGNPIGSFQWDVYTNFSNNTQDPTKGLIQPYMKAAAIQTCPDMPTPLILSSYTDGFTTGYGVNYYLSDATYAGNQATDPAATSTGGVLASDSSVQQPSDTVLMADAISYYNIPAANLVGYAADNSLLPPSYWGSVGTCIPTFHARHTDHGEVLFCDGHVKAMSPVYFSTNDLFGDTPTQQQAHKTGAIMQQNYTGNYKVDDYYYELNKS